MKNYRANTINTFWGTPLGKFFSAYILFNALILTLTELAIYEYHLYLYTLVGFVLITFTVIVVIKAWRHTNLHYFILRFSILLPMFVLLIGWPTLRTIAVISTVANSSVMHDSLVLYSYSRGGGRYNSCSLRIRLLKNNRKDFVCAENINFINLTEYELHKANDAPVNVGVTFNYSLGVTIIESIEKI